MNLFAGFKLTQRASQMLMLYSGMCHTRIMAPQSLYSSLPLWKSTFQTTFSSKDLGKQLPHRAQSSDEFRSPLRNTLGKLTVAFVLCNRQWWHHWALRAKAPCTSILLLDQPWFPTILLLLLHLQSSNLYLIQFLWLSFTLLGYPFRWQCPGHPYHVYILPRA